jgi:hypothetical protein
VLQNALAGAPRRGRPHQPGRDGAEGCRDSLAAKGCGQDYGPYGPDSLWNYEAGAKTRWLDGALTVYAA